MYFITLLLVTFIIFNGWHLHANIACFKAKSCVHNANEKCGVNENGHLRRFLDTCDLYEYNCANHKRSYSFTDYTKVPYEKCTKLPPIRNDDSMNLKIINTNEEPVDTREILNPEITDADNNKTQLKDNSRVPYVKYFKLPPMEVDGDTNKKIADINDGRQETLENLGNSTIELKGSTDKNSFFFYCGRC